MKTTLESSAASSATTRESRIYQKLVESPLYQTYKAAFMDATGLGLALIPADDDPPAEGETLSCNNAFCEALNRIGKKCEGCHLTLQCLKSLADETIETTTCFARMRESAIPIKSANQTIAFLTTGQVFTEQPQKKDFPKVANRLRNLGIESDEIESLKNIWLESRVMPVDQYKGIITLLAAFGLQLSELVNRLMIEETNSEPDIVTRAKQFVCAHLEEKVNLEDVAKRVGVSTFYFCKVFKAATGMTLTEYVNRRRVEWAKRKLLNPQVRVTEVAFAVGYQSLSQFNRSFLKYVGTSPTRYRESQSSEQVSATSIAA